MEKQLVAVIKRKKELAGLPNTFVLEQLHKYTQSHAREMRTLSENFNSKSALFKGVVKKVREALRRSTGLFQMRKKVKLAGSVHKQAQQLLSMHASTSERMPFYPELYRKIFALNPKKILDLGCGLNPLSVIFFPEKADGKVDSYQAYDINGPDVAIVNDLFRRMNFPGKTQVADINNISQLQLPPADVAFLFKVTDILDRKGHKKTEEILKAVPARYVIVSFSTRTMSGRKMTAPRRRWMEWLCRRLGYGYEIWVFENEIFYVIKKSKNGQPITKDTNNLSNSCVL